MTNLTPVDILVTRTWNSTPISRRTADGYVNATAMCKANGKEWSNYYKSERTSQYLQALQGSLPNGGHLVQVIGTGPNEGRGTYVHPRLAVDLARWISPEFAVWLDGWFLEKVVEQSQPVPQPLQLTPEVTLACLERSVNLLERIGGFDDRDRIQFSDMIRNTAARASGGLLLPPGAEFMAVTDLLLECGASATEASRLASGLGREIKRLYRDEFQADPSQRTQSVNGRPTKVSNYPESWLRQQAEFVKNWIQDRISQ
jgi:hypothetical protein